MSAQNKAIVRRVLEEVWGKGNMATADQLIAANHVGHNDPPGLPSGREGQKQMIAAYRRAFPDMSPTIEDQLSEGDRVVTRWTARGTHKGDMMGIKATGKKVEFSGITINRLANGQIVESWPSFDQLGLMQQLGVIPK